MTYYRKYRPQTVAELDLTKVREAFLRILSSGSLAHAYLLTGPKGTGKTSSARILAKVVNCHRNRRGKDTSRALPLGEPCNECNSCKSIMAGTSLAVIEMDAASNRGIDDIRLLRERVALSPGEMPYAVYVIDEVHMLTNEAFNALLKTLEEPPSHALFALCTTELQKVPDTIISRCTLIPFTQATPEEITHSLEKAVTGEGLNISKEALWRLAKRVDGSFRDAMNLLEQLSLLKSPIGEAEVDEITGYGSLYDVTSLIEALDKKDAKAGLLELEHRREQGGDIPTVGKRLVEVLRQELLADLLLTPRNENRIHTRLQLLELFTQAVLNIKTSVIPSLPLEMAVGEWCLQGEPVVENEVSSNEMSVASKKQPEKRVQDPRPPEILSSKPRVEVQEPVKETHSPVMANSITFEDIQAKWGEIMRGVRPYNHSLEALLRAARPFACDEKGLVIEVFYVFHKEQLEQDKHLSILEKVMKDVCGVPVKMRFKLGNKARKAMIGNEQVAQVTGTLEDEHVAEAVEEIFGK